MVALGQRVRSVGMDDRAPGLIHTCRVNVLTPSRLTAVALFALSAAACGGGGSSSGGSPPTVYDTPPAQTVAVPSSSMEPTLHCAAPGSGCEGNIADDVVIDATDGSKVKRGDIVAFRAPPLAERCGSGGTFVQRVIALPGETWEERNGDIYIDGKKLTESYINPDRRDTATSYPSRQIPAGSVFVMGDNRTQSCDSRVYGPVPVVNVSGRVAKIIRHSS